MCTTIRNCLAGLRNLGFPTEDWDPIILRMAMRKFDNETVRIFEESMEVLKDFPSVVRLRISAETISASPGDQTSSDFISDPKKKTSTTLSKPGCSYCKREHAIFACDTFKDLSVDERCQIVRQKKSDVDIACPTQILKTARVKPIASSAVNIIILCCIIKRTYRPIPRASKKLPTFFWQEHW